MPYLTGDTPTPNKFICRRLRIPDDQGFLLAVNGAVSTLLHSYNWEQFGSVTPDEAATMGLDLWMEYLNSEVCMIGTITAYITTTPPPHCLPCNGSIYQRVDYPVLYERLAAAYLIDADSFRTPDLRDKFIIGASTNYPLASTGGAVEHTLTEAQLAPHIHTNSPHSHTEAIAAPTIVSIGLEPPVPSAVPGAGITGLSSVSIDSAGGGQPFPTIPPYEALLYCIVAR